MAKTKNTTPEDKQNARLMRILIIQIVVMMLLLFQLSGWLTLITRRDTVGQSQTITQERAQMIEDYVQNVEETLIAYSRAGEIKALLENPGDAQFQKAAQKYTETFSADIDNLEGIYTSNWDTETLVHTNPGTIGLVTRTDPDKLQQLHDAMLDAGDGVYDTGIIVSPASGKQIVSMYKAVYNDKGDPIGLVGMGIYTDGLVDILDELAENDTEGTFYDMINMNNNTYAFIDNPEMVGMDVTFPEILDTINSINNNTAATVGNFEFKKNDEGNRRYVTTYAYIKDYNWLFEMSVPRDQIYNLSKQIRLFMLLYGTLMIGLIVMFGIIIRRQQIANRKLGKQIAKTEITKESLETAMFKDILTDVKNRISFSMDLDTIKTDPEHPCYFAMFNVSQFSGINVAYGNDAGDAVLANTAEILVKAFPDGAVYRTGSDEFIVAIQKNDNSVAAYNQVYRQINEAHSELLKPQETPGGVLNVDYKIALVKKSTELNTSVITVLKDVTNRTGKTAFGQAQYVDMDTMEMQ